MATLAEVGEALLGEAGRQVELLCGIVNVHVAAEDDEDHAAFRVPRRALRHGVPLLPDVVFKGRRVNVCPAVAGIAHVIERLPHAEGSLSGIFHTAR